MTKIHTPFPGNGQIRAVIENVSPELDGGRYAVKAIVNQTIQVTADVLVDGHDLLAVRLLYKHESEKEWCESMARHLVNDRWISAFTVQKQGFYLYRLEAWVDHQATWQHEADEKIKDGQHLEVELMVGEKFLTEMALMAGGDDRKALKQAARLLTDPERYEEATMFCRSEQLHSWIEKYHIKKQVCFYPERKVFVDRPKAEFSAWYSMFPRSASPEYGRHGTFNDVIDLLPRIAELGFDVLYLPPVHPIGHTFRKGKNNAVHCEDDEPGVPYGIGSALGGHTDIHPELGTLDDFKRLIEEASKAGVEVAMDLAIQCSPDHPWVKSHPDWFRILPDGTIKYAENPPKKYQDIYPVNFETEDWENLWLELKNVIYTWASWGVRIIRVDNPHTKSFGFWEWVIAETRRDYPGMIFLSEAFTKPKVMQQLAKVGFNQSYTYYAWRITKAELTEYMTELTRTDMKDYFRPNFWPNTHDINPFILQTGNESQFLIRYFMAATLSSSYGIFGPTYEYLYHAANTPKEEYFNSEKYEIKWWNWSHRNKLTYIITQVNRIRRENTALKSTNNIEFCEIGNDQLLAYLKTSSDGNRLLIIVNLDQDHIQGGILKVPLSKIYKHESESYQVHDLITGAKYVWQGVHNYVELDPNILPFHLFRIEDI